MTPTALEPDAPTSALTLDDQLCFAAYSASRALVAAYRRGLHDLGLTYTQYLVLLVLWERPRVSVGELGTALALDSGTLSPLLKRMEGADLVVRTRGRDDERTVWIAPTPRAEALLPEARRVQRGVRQATGLDDAALAALRAELRDLTAALDAAHDL